MENVWITLISVAGGIIATLIGFLIEEIRRRKKITEEKNKELKAEEELNEKYKEMLNYVFGQVDMIIQDSIKVEPEIREAMRKASKRYHKLDLVKIDKKGGKNEKVSNKTNN